MKLKILNVSEIEVDDGNQRNCSDRCNFFFNEEGPPYCNAFNKDLEVEEGGCARVSECFKAVGNHNILSKCMAGE